MDGNGEQRDGTVQLDLSFPGQRASTPALACSPGAHSDLCPLLPLAQIPLPEMPPLHSAPSESHLLAPRHLPRSSCFWPAPKSNESVLTPPGEAPQLGNLLFLCHLKRELAQSLAPHPHPTPFKVDVTQVLASEGCGNAMKAFTA